MYVRRRLEQHTVASPRGGARGVVAPKKNFLKWNFAPLKNFWELGRIMVTFLLIPNKLTFSTKNYFFQIKFGKEI